MNAEDAEKWRKGKERDKELQDLAQKVRFIC